MIGAVADRPIKFLARPWPCAGGSHVWTPRSCRAVALGDALGDPMLDFLCDIADAID